MSDTNTNTSPFKPVDPVKESPEQTTAANTTVSAETEGDDEPEKPSKEELERQELEILRGRARMMGLNVSGNIGLATLKAKIAEKAAADNASAQPTPVGNQTPQEVNPLTALDTNDYAPATPTKPVRKRTLRQMQMEEQMKLVRLRISNLNPAKKDLHGEVFTVANEYIGSVRKFVPFGEFTEEGYHVPYCIYRQLQEKLFLNIRTRKDRRTGQTLVENNWVKEFALEVLPPLTEEELAKLASAQLAAGSVG